MSKIYLEAISKQHLAVLNKLKNIKNLVLVGGTALALQIGHRKSYDLDFITEQKITSIQNKIQQNFQGNDIKQRLLNESQYTLTIDQISVTFFHDSPLLYPTINWKTINLASIHDIFSSKLFILGKRATWRDYVDIVFLLKSKKVKLSQGIEDAVKRYKIAKKWILEPLAYFEDISIIPIEWLDQNISDTEVKNYLTEETKQYLTKI